MTESEQRNEGGILPWPENEKDPKPGELDPQQRAAALKAHELFVGMANRVEKPAPRESELDAFLPRLDAYRGNHTILIDGTRGSGKTAVMLRLLQDWSDSLRAGGSVKAPLDRYTLETGVQLVPVGLLDLEAVPQTANLATRIAGMFERVVSAMEPRGARDERSPSAPNWALLQDDTLKSREKWQHFVGAAALEWDRSLERRRASIDPEAYAVEVEQAERRGLQARECFRAFINALVKDWKGWRQQATQPFFIVPIDDADLNPARVVELFGLLRTLWHPRVGYLLTGDSGLFTHVLTTHFRSQIDMAELLAPGGFGGGAPIRLMDDPSRMAEGLARDLYQKAVPLVQRLKIEPLLAAQRLDVVEDVLSRALLVNNSVETLGDYMLADDLGPLALPGRWRQIIDLRNRLKSGEFEKPFGAERMAYALWCHALDEQPLSEFELEGLRGVVRLGEGGPEPMFQGFAPVDIVFLSASTRVASNHFGSVVVHSRIAAQGSFKVSQRKIELGVAALASLFLLYNITRPRHASLDIAPEGEYNLVLVEAPFFARMNDDVLVSEEAPGFDLMLRFRWPVPAWKRYLETQRLCRQWEHLVALSLGDVGELARRFLLLVFRVSGQQVADDMTWAELASLVVNEAQSRRTALGDWAYRYAGLLASPESGLPETAANVWMDALHEQASASGTWEGFRAFLKRTRRNRVELALNEVRAAEKLPALPATKQRKAVDVLIVEIDNQAPFYSWVSLVEASRRD